jgi:hypothetical protein
VEGYNDLRKDVGSAREIEGGDEWEMERWMETCVDDGLESESGVGGGDDDGLGLGICVDGDGVGYMKGIGDDGVVGRMRMKERLTESEVYANEIVDVPGMQVPQEDWRPCLLLGPCWGCHRH